MTLGVQCVVVCPECGAGRVPTAVSVTRERGRAALRPTNGYSHLSCGTVGAVGPGLGTRPAPIPPSLGTPTHTLSRPTLPTSSLTLTTSLFLYCYKTRTNQSDNSDCNNPQKW